MRRDGRRHGAGRAVGLLLGALLAGGPPPAAAQAMGQGMNEAMNEGMNAALAASLDAGRAAFERLPEADRIAIQDALVWTGDYSSAADGSFGRRTFEAIQAYQRRARQPATGILDPPVVKALIAGGERARTASGFTVVHDPPTGIRLGVPQKLLTKRSANGNGGSRFQSADGRVTLDTRALEGDEEDLKELYERALGSQGHGRTVTYRLLRPDLFVVGGETPGGKFFSRYALGPPGIRAFSIGYDKALAADIDRVVVAVSNSFVPFPAAAVAGRGRPEGAANPPRRRPAVVQTGLAISPRHILTAAPGLEGCRDLRVDGAPARVASVEAANGLALLETGGPHRTAPLVLATGEAAEAGSVLFVAPGEGGKPVAAPAEILPRGRLIAPLQPGSAGALVLDGSGAMLGLVTAPALGPRNVAGIVPPASHPYTRAPDLARFLGPEAPPPARAGEAPRGSGSVAAALAPALASVTCGPTGDAR